MKMPEITKIAAIKCTVIFTVFIIFLSAAIGLLEITISNDPMISISSHLVNQVDGYKLSLDQLIKSKGFVFLITSGLVLTFALPILTPIKAFTLTFLMIILTISTGYTYPGAGLIPMEYCLLTILVIYMMNILVSYFIEIHAKQKLMETFGKYVPPHLVKELSQLPDGVSLAGEAKTLTVFFCDLQDFTSISEQLNPIQLNKLLNEYFTVMTEILFKHEATIDKYIGDAIMAFWNAPIKQEKHAQHAVEAAMEMDKAIKELARKFISRGWPGPTMGTGVNTGRANVGNMGSKYRMTYTAIGDAVNLASRIESLTRTYRVPIIISEHTYKQLSGITCRELDQVRVKGKHQLTRIYEPLGYDAEISNTLKEKLVIHEKAMALYYSGKEHDASRLFKELYEKDKTDKFYKAILKKIIGV